MSHTQTLVGAYVLEVGSSMRLADVGGCATKSSPHELSSVWATVATQLSAIDRDAQLLSAPEYGSQGGSNSMSMSSMDDDAEAFKSDGKWQYPCEHALVGVDVRLGYKRFQPSCESIIHAQPSRP